MMEGEVALKVFLHGSYDQVRKIRWKFGGCDDDFQELGRSLGQCFGVGDEVLVLGYDDEEGDRVTIGGNQELMDWRKETKTSPLKLHLTIAKPPMFDVDLASNKGDDHNVACVCCHDNIVGFRYKCVICPAYEICAKCESRANHPGHDMIRIAKVRPYPQHFFTRLHRLYERLMMPSLVPSCTTASPAGLEVMARDLVDSEVDVEDLDQEFLTPDDLTKEDLTSIEELTRHMQNLAEKEDEAVNEAVRYDFNKNVVEIVKEDISSDHEKVENVAQVLHEKVEDVAEVLHEKVEDVAKVLSIEASEANDVIAEIQSEKEEAKSVEVAIEPPHISSSPKKENSPENTNGVDERSDTSSPMPDLEDVTDIPIVGTEESIPETIQGLRREIDKLLAPLAPNSRLSTSPRLSTPSRTSATPDKDSVIIRTRAIVEDNFGKRERQPSDTDEENPSRETPSKFPRRSNMPSTSEAIEFDAITVAEVVEVENECENFAQELELESESEEEVEKKDEDYFKGEKTSCCQSEEREEKPKGWRERINYDAVTKKFPEEEEEEEEEDEDPWSRLDIRRALNRAGLESSYLPTSAKYTALKYSNMDREYENLKAKETSPPPTPSTSKARDFGSRYGSSREYREYRSLYAQSGPTRVSESLKQMLAMGFSDDDGWLTQLLTLKRGNIDEVLEVLTPVEKGL